MRKRFEAILPPNSFSAEELVERAREIQDTLAALPGNVRMVTITIECQWCSKNMTLPLDNLDHHLNVHTLECRAN